MLSKKADSTASFRHQGIIYYPDMTIRRLSESDRQQYQHCILDFGCPTSYMLPEFIRCNRKLLLMNVSIWKDPQLEKFALQLQRYHISWDHRKIIGMGGNKKDYERLSKLYGIHAVPMPYLEDPFYITSKKFSFFEQIMKGE